MADHRLVNKRLKRAYFFGKLLSWLPYIRCVILNGSLAQGKAKKYSDIDILIITKAKRIFSARFFVNIFAKILGIKRSKDENKSHSGKFCLNYFLTENFLKIPVGRGEKIDKYCAENYSKSVFLAGDCRLFVKFMCRNWKLFKRYNCEIDLPKGPKKYCHPDIRQPADEGPHSYGILRHRNKMAQNDNSWFENWAKKYQIKRIEKDPRTQKYPELIVYNDKELRFHPPKKQ